MNGKKGLLFEENEEQKSGSDRHKTSARISSELKLGAKSRCPSIHYRQDKWEIICPPLNVKFTPKIDEIFYMFTALSLKDIKVVIMGQDPYPGKCPITGIDYACGPAFKISDKVKTCPQSLKNLFTEFKTDVLKKSSVSVTLDYIKKHVKHWINQGVFLTNASLTRGTEGNYLDDHKMFWMNFTISFIKSVRNCPIVLLGSESWKFEKFVDESVKVLKFYHPASRDGKFFDCKMFTSINENIIGEKIMWTI